MHVEGACLVAKKGVLASMRAQGSHRQLQASDFISASFWRLGYNLSLTAIGYTLRVHNKGLSAALEPHGSLDLDPGCHQGSCNQGSLIPGLQMSSSQVMSELQCPAQRTLCSACLYLDSLAAPFWIP